MFSLYENKSTCVRICNKGLSTGQALNVWANDFVLSKITFSTLWYAMIHHLFVFTVCLSRSSTDTISLIQTRNQVGRTKTKQTKHKNNTKKSDNKKGERCWSYVYKLWETKQDYLFQRFSCRICKHIDFGITRATKRTFNFEISIASQ